MDTYPHANYIVLDSETGCFEEMELLPLAMGRKLYVWDWIPQNSSSSSAILCLPFGVMEQVAVLHDHLFIAWPQNPFSLHEKHVHENSRLHRKSNHSPPLQLLVLCQQGRAELASDFHMFLLFFPLFGAQSI